MRRRLTLEGPIAELFEQAEQAIPEVYPDATIGQQYERGLCLEDGKLCAWIATPGGRVTAHLTLIPDEPNPLPTRTVEVPYKPDGS